MDILKLILLTLIGVFIIMRIMLVKSVDNISIEEAKEKTKDKKIQFIDVRTPLEFKNDKRRPFKNIPIAVLHGQLSKLDKDREVVVICQTGMRSARAARILKKAGFETVYNVKGGVNAWH